MANANETQLILADGHLKRFALCACLRGGSLTSDSDSAAEGIFRSISSSVTYTAPDLQAKMDTQVDDLWKGFPLCRSEDPVCSNMDLERLRDDSWSACQAQGTNSAGLPVLSRTVTTYRMYCWRHAPRAVKFTLIICSVAPR